MRRPRILWCYDHPIARYQETLLFIDAGAEVITLLGDVATKSVDMHYHNEAHPLYPDWRSNVTLPSDVVERVRRVPLYTSRGELDPADRALINATVDVIVTPGEPACLDSLLKWFTGIILYRANGAVNRELFFGNLKAIEEVARRRKGRLWYAPGLRSLVPDFCDTLTKYQVFLPVWVDLERTPYRWSAIDSLARIGTGISYIDFHPHFRNQYLSFREHLHSLPHVIVGKNDKRSCYCADNSILGSVTASELYSTIAACRVFVDSGDMPEHLVFPPIEAMAMGVPTFFTSSSALAGILRDENVPGIDWARLGYVKHYSDLYALLRERVCDFDFLTNIAIRQHEFFIGTVFSRALALKAFQAFLSTVRDDMVRRGVAKAVDTTHFDNLRVSAIPHRGNSVGSMEVLHFHNATLRARPTEIRGDVGLVARRANGEFVRSVVPGRDPPGFIAIDYLPSLDVGKYLLTIVLTSAMQTADKRRRSCDVIAGFGEWSESEYSETPLRLLAAADRTTLTCSFTVESDSVGRRREIRVKWNGCTECSLEFIELRRDGGAA